MEWTDVFQTYGPGRRTDPGGLKDAALSNRLAAYKRQVAKRYRVIEPEAIGSQLPKGKLWISSKVDGELWFAVKKEGDVALCAYNGRVLQGVPVVDEIAKALEKAEDVVIAGELFAVPDDPKAGRPRCYHVTNAFGKPELAKTLGFKAFDLVEEKGQEQLTRTYKERYDRLKQLFDGGKRSDVVMTVEGEAEQASSYYREWVSTGKFEGIVVRSEQGITYKIKPTFTLDAVIVAFGERVQNDVGQVRELEVGLRRDDGTLHILGSVGGGFSEDDRVAWHKRLTPLIVPSSFRLANREGTLCRFVKPEIVVEVKCNDLVESDASDMPIRRMVVKFDEVKGWGAVTSLPIASMVSPVFQRERADKTTDVGSIGLDQIYSRLPFGSRYEAAASEARSTSTAVQRRVWVKETKGKTAVRKFVALATNKGGDPAYPPFVIHFTDFSDGRAEPMKVALRVAASEAKVKKHIDVWIEENVKRGWVEIGAGGAKMEPPKVEKPAKAKTEQAPAAAADAAPGATPVAEGSEPPKKKRAPRKKKDETPPSS